MTIRERLNQGFYIEIELKAKKEQIMILKDYAMSVKKTNDCIAESECVCAWIDIENDLKRDVKNLMRAKEESLRIINSIDDVRLRTLLTLRYINYKKIDEIAEIMHYSKRHIDNLLKKALSDLEAGFSVPGSCVKKAERSNLDI